MKLLFDHNLSPRLVERLADPYPQSSHVFLLGLDQALDSVVWHYAASHDYTIVTKDSDFSDLSVMLGFPPKVIWMRLGNCATSVVEQRLRDSSSLAEAFLYDPTGGILELLAA